ncbi:DsbA family protein [soil metagenome]
MFARVSVAEVRGGRYGEGKKRVPEQSLTVFADYVCPFCYLAESGLDRLRADGDETGVAAYELRPAGTALPTMTETWLQASWERTVEPLARSLGVVMRYPTVATRTRKAHEAVAYARSTGALQAMHDAIYRAYWEDGRDIGRIDVLVEIGASVGLEVGGLRVALDIDQWTQRVDQDLAWAGRLGLTGVPAYLLRRSQRDGHPAEDELRVGLQRYEELRSWV